ncbi:UdgX family uracil-DNA binding protein [Sphingosinicella sp. LHD-64]|uniref:UdgX family uracil-DNA binding protein n=1 Tax=Sphingosinicella sp. LHD-64 TaxID=3072139 RepID=UPI00280EBAFD|nr:UdgX family uracil-DNA binding protein [Sphingosinicella sp. LHD-64]MDQ8757074.1 UdgX family uracil-DNA binding protein [Sphingosinicella sp. LHD-64]
MRTVRLAAEDDFDGWRSAARALALVHAAPEEVLWQVESEVDLFNMAPAPAPPAAEGAFSVPRPFVDLARTVIRHRDPERFSLLYAFLCRLRDNPRAMEDAADPLLRRLELMARAVRRDMHKTRAFPQLCEPGEDEWKNMSETALMPDLIAGAQAWETQMVAASVAEMAGGNVTKRWESVCAEAAHCTRCDLYKHATQTVFGEGPLGASIVFVGEQPGDQEDLAGKPFVGPAGQLFDKALAEAGIDRKRTYVTNAVKHFKFVRRGKRRIHEKPNGGEIAACRSWIQQELALIRPELTVALGATAARSLFGKAVTISALRGKGHALADVGEAWVTVHPSFLLRVRDNKEEEYARFVEDLGHIGKRARALA